MKWPHGALTQEDIELLESKAAQGYDTMRLDEKLAYIFSRFGKVETPNEDTTSMRGADKAVADAISDVDKVFEMMWFLTKDDALLRAVCKVWQRYYDKKGGIIKFKNKIYKMRKQQEWLKKQEEKKKKNRYRY